MKIFKYLALLLLFTIITSCENYLDKTNPNALSTELISSESDEDLTLILYGCYSALQKSFIDGYQYLEGLTDVAYSARYHILPISIGGSDPNNDYYRDCWTRQYRLIVRCNELLGILGSQESPSSNMKCMEGETKFMRALAYFYLTALYKDVPLITTPQSFADRFVTKNSQAEVKSQILDDLDDAILLLPDILDYPRATKGAALALKAKVHAFFNEYSEVVSLTQAILDLGQYDLYPDYFKLFSVEAEGSAEAIFSIAFETAIGQGEDFSGSYPVQPFLYQIYPLSNYVNAFYCTDGLPITESPLYNPVRYFENRDPRYERSILRHGVIWLGAPYNSSRSPTKYQIRKYVENKLQKGDGPQDYMVIRLADILLLRAEALVETDNLNEEVYNLVDRVRSRVNMPGIEQVEGTDLTKDEMLNLIRHERLVELGLEGTTRWFDLKRWNMVEETYESITFHDRPYLGEKTLWWPIPQDEIDNNPSLIQHTFWN